MTPPSRAKIISRIRKCLALAASSQPHEAAAALRQAQKMMAQHRINAVDVELSAVAEAHVPAGRSAQVPPLWLAGIAQVVSEAFGVEKLYTTCRGRPSQFCFTGIGASAEVAGYAFTVLRRQCEAARTAYYTKLKSRRSKRVLQADMYATGWIAAVDRTVRDFAQAVPGVVHDYIDKKTTNRERLAPIERFCSRDAAHARVGYKDGQNVRLHHGVGEHAVKRLEESKP